MDDREGLLSSDLAQRLTAVENLSLLGPDAAYAAVELVNACADEEEVRDFAVAALEELGPPPADSLSTLTQLVASKNALVAYWAITLLGRAGVKANCSQDALTAALSSAKDVSVRERAAWALGQVGADSQAASQELNQAASSSESRLSRIAKTSLQQMQSQQQ